MLSDSLKNFLSSPAKDLVILVSDEFPPETGFGGIGSYTWNMSRGLIQAGCRVVVISKAVTQSTIAIDQDLVVIRYCYSALWLRLFFRFCRLLSMERTVRSLLFSWNVYWQVRQIKKITKVLAVEGPEWSGQLFFLAIFGVSFAVRIHTPLAKIMSLDGVALTFDNRLSLKMESVAVDKAATIFYASDVSLDDARLSLPIHKQKLVKSPLPIDRQVFCSQPSRAANPTIIFVGRLEAKKGPDLLIESLPLIKQKVPNLRCIIVGPDGRDEQGESMQNKLQAMITASGLTEVVEFVGGKTYLQLPAYLQKSWVLINPSKFESFGMTSLEAVSCGARTVVGDSVGFSEWLQPSLGSKSERSPSAIAKAAIPYLLTRPHVDQDYINQTFGQKVVAELALKVYREMRPQVTD